MATTRRAYFERAKKILQIIQEEKISSLPKNKAFGKALESARQLTQAAAIEAKMIGPGLVGCVATTLMGMGLCQELSQRFVLEYCILYKEKNVSLIFLSGPNTKNNHALVLIGSPAGIPDNLYVGRGGSDVLVDMSSVTLSLPEFLAANQQSTLADPLVGCAGISDEEMAPLLKYCSEHRLTHVIGVRSFLNTPSLVENANSIKANAVKISTEIRPSIDLTGFSAPAISVSSERKVVAKESPLTRNFKERAEIKYEKTTANEYLDRLNQVLGTGIVKKNGAHSVSFPTFWLRQLGDGAKAELSEELGVSKTLFRV